MVEGVGPSSSQQPPCLGRDVRGGAAVLGAAVDEVAAEKYVRPHKQD